MPYVGESFLFHLFNVMTLDRAAGKQSSFGYLDSRGDMLLNAMNGSMHICARRAGVIPWQSVELVMKN